MNNENKYYYINKLPKEYHRVIWDIMIIAQSDEELDIKFNKDKAKILMRYLYKITKNSDNWNSLREWLNDKVLTRAGSSIDLAIENHSYCKVLDKMNELEKRNENEK